MLLAQSSTASSLWRMTRMKTALALLAALAVLAAAGYAAVRSSRHPLEWTRVTLGGDCHCADGSGFAIWQRRADPTKVPHDPGRALFGGWRIEDMEEKGERDERGGL